MKVIRLNEQQYNYCVDNLYEDVYINDINDKKKTATLTYNQVPSSSNGSYRNVGNKNSADVIKTDKMDKLDGDTYPVPLKGGLISYNITSINGTAVMHFFKHNGNALIKMGNQDYKLDMEQPEIKKFQDTFLSKVSAVVRYHSQNFLKDNKDVQFDKVCVYPVPSSSNFNETMATAISGKCNIAGLPIQKVRSDILKKDTTNLERDEEFISNNAEYYNSQRYKRFPADAIRKEKETHMHALNTDMNKLKAMGPVRQAAEEANAFVRTPDGKNGPLLTIYYRIQNAINTQNEKAFTNLLQQLDDVYTQYQHAVDNLHKQRGEYVDTYDDSVHRQTNLHDPVKYTKPKSVEDRTRNIYNLLKYNGLGKNLIGGGVKNTINKFPVCAWKANNFQIKNFANDTRMALKNYFQPNQDKEMVQQEVDKTHGSIIVVFDDNVSGGATLSDICMQLQNLGMEYIIPITFGKMRQSYNQGRNVEINRPKTDFVTNYQSNQRLSSQGQQQTPS